MSGTNSDEIPDKVYKKGLRIQKEQFFNLVGRLATSFPSEFRAFCVGQESKQSDIDGLVVTNTGLMKEIATLEDKVKELRGAILGVGVDGSRVILIARGGNSGARDLCGALLDLADTKEE